MRRRIIAYYGPPGRYRVARVSTQPSVYVILDTKTGRAVGTPSRWLPPLLREALQLRRP